MGVDVMIRGGQMCDVMNAKCRCNDQRGTNGCRYNDCKVSKYAQM